MSLLDPDRLAALYGLKPASKEAERDEHGKRKQCCKRFKDANRCADCPLKQGLLGEILRAQS